MFKIKKAKSPFWNILRISYFENVHILASALFSGIHLWTEDKRLKEAARKLNVLYK